MASTYRATGMRIGRTAAGAPLETAANGRG
jgi:hypothetical protein